jgi:hypothetical protein
MANEIKFVFTGDTADFDKAIDSIVKKTNKIKSADKDANKVRKQAVSLEKLLADEYKNARKNAGSLTDITKKLAREETKRLEINRKLSSETLSQSRRQSLILEKSKSQARTSGLKGAGVAGMAKLAAATMVAAIAAGAGVILKETFSAIGEAQGIRSGAAASGQSIEAFQTNQFAASINRDPKVVGAAIKSLGLIIDTDLNRKLTDAGDKLRIVSAIINQILKPAFALVAEKLGEFAIQIAAVLDVISEKGIKKTAVAAGTAVAKSRIASTVISAIPTPISSLMATGLPTWLANKFGGAADTEFGEDVEKSKKTIKELIDEIIGAAIVSNAPRQAAEMRGFSDSLARIGLFKSGRDSQLQTMRASLAVQKGIQTNTDGLKDIIFNA